VNREAVNALNRIGHTLTTLGHDLVELTNALFEELDRPRTPSAAPTDKYSQAAKDARQHPILALFEPLDASREVALPWEGPGSVTEAAFEHGYTSKSVGALLMNRGLLRWVDQGKTVTITDRGRTRFREIEARLNRTW
jgi:hypothetical protein